MSTATRRRTATALSLLTLALVACGSGGGSSTPTTATTSTTTSTTAAPEITTTTLPPAVPFDWGVRARVDLPGGWTVAACRGDAPLACVTQGGEQVGVVEQLGFPVATLPVVEDALAGGAGPQEALEALAEDDLRSIAADRRAGCDPAYTIRPVGPEAAPVGGRPGIRYGYEGVSGRGAVVERSSKHLLLADDAVYFVVANALEPGGCLEPEGEFRVAVLERFAPQLARLAAGSRFRPPAEPGP